MDRETLHALVQALAGGDETAGLVLLDECDEAGCLARALEEVSLAEEQLSADLDQAWRESLWWRHRHPGLPEPESYRQLWERWRCVEEVQWRLRCLLPVGD
jgi:hypothetical protein